MSILTKPQEEILLAIYVRGGLHYYAPGAQKFNILQRLYRHGYATPIADPRTGKPDLWRAVLTDKGRIEAQRLTVNKCKLMLRRKAADEAAARHGTLAPTHRKP